jgi:SOS-response transcriptional repressor LexA
MAIDIEQTATSDNELNCWTDRIKVRLKELDMTQDALANKMGITRSAITHYLAGRRVPSLSQLQKLAEALETSPSWLQFGEVRSLEINERALRDELLSCIHKVPIVSWKQISVLKDIKNLHPNEIFAWVPHFYSDEPNSFALVLTNDTMTSPSIQITSFHEGEIIILDSTIIPKNGDFVVAIPTNSNAAIFRQYVVDGNMQYLKPLNPQYPILQVDEGTIICGVHTHTLCVGKRD